MWNKHLGCQNKMVGLMGVGTTTDDTNTQLVSGSRSNFNTILNKPKI